MDELFVKLLGLLEKLEAEKGVPKEQSLIDANIADPNTPENKVSPNLKGNEIRRTMAIANVFAKAFFDFQKKNVKDEKPQTLVSQISRTQQKAKEVPEKSNRSWGSIMSLLVGGVALVTAAIPTIIASLFAKIGPLADSLKILGKAGLVGGLTMIAKGMGKFFSVTVLKRIPIVGSLINFWFAYKEFKSGRYAPAIMELVAGILNFVPGMGTVLSIGVDMLKMFLDSKGMFDEGGALSNGNIMATMKGWVSNIGKYISDNALYLPIVGTFKRFGMAGEAFKSGKWGEGIKQIALGMLTFGGGGILIKGFEVLQGFLNNKENNQSDLSPDNSWSSRLKNWLKDKLKQLPYALRKPLEWFGIIDGSGEDAISMSGIGENAKKGAEGLRSFVSSAWDKVQGPMKDTVDSVSNFAVDAWKKTKDFSSKAWDIAKEEGPKLWTSIKETSSKAMEAAKNAGSMYMNGMNLLVTKTKEKIAEWAPSVIQVIGGIADNAMKVLKGIAEKIGTWIANLFTPEEQKTLQGNTSSKREELFSRKDQDTTIALLTSSNIQSKWLSLLYDASKEQVKLLSALVNINNQQHQELKRISGNPGRGGSGNVNISLPSTPQKTPLVPVSNNRGGYASSPYALA